MSCPTCGKSEDWCRCNRWCDLCGCWSNHTTTMHADKLVQDCDELAESLEERNNT